MDHTDLCSFLPPEVRILSIIFGFLPLDDRKNVRLVCRSFNYACTSPKIMKREKFVFRFGYFEVEENATLLVNTLARCKRMPSVIEFRAMNLTELPISVWKNLGNRIESLFLDECEVDEEIIEHIFLHYSNLVHFRLASFTKAALFSTEQNVLDRLIERRVERTKLRTFLVFTRKPLSDNTYQKIFQIFPNIQTLGRDFYYLSTPSESRLRREQRCISRPIPLSPTVESLVYNMNANSSWMIPYTNHPKLKFKELELTITVMNDHGMETIVNFFSSQNEIERIRLRILVGNMQFVLVKDILFLLLRTLPKLKVLKFHANSLIHFSEQELAELLSDIRNLESLRLYFCAFKCEGEFLTRFPATVKYELPFSGEYDKLADLKLELGSTKSLQAARFQWEILSRCRSLRCLHLGYVNDEILKHILKYQTELRMLSLNCFDCCTTASIEHHSWDGLRKLEHLTTRCRLNAGFSNVSYYVNLVVVFLSKLNCSGLKVFVCETSGLNPDAASCISAEDTIRLFYVLSTCAPLLETLKLHSVLSLNEYYPYCRRLKKLRYLVRSDTSHEPSHKEFLETFSRLFDECPSLIYIVNCEYHAENVCFYDRINNTLIPHYAIPLYSKPICRTLNIL